MLWGLIYWDMARRRAASGTIFRLRIAPQADVRCPSRVTIVTLKILRDFEDRNQSTSPLKGLHPNHSEMLNEMVNGQKNWNTQASAWLAMRRFIRVDQEMKAARDERCCPTCQRGKSSFAQAPITHLFNMGVSQNAGPQKMAGLLVHKTMNG